MLGECRLELWDPMTGRVGPAEVAEKTAKATTVGMTLEPYGSTLIVFTNRTLPASPKAPAVAFVPGPLDLSSNWTVRFGKDAQPVTMDKLVSWTEDPATKDFSGVATYEKTIDVAPEMLKEGLSLSLSLGQAIAPQDSDTGRRGGSQRFAAALEAPVREAAVVYVNDQRVGSVWAPPYALDVTGKLKPGANAIRIEAANLAINYMVAHGYPNYNLQGVRKQFGNRFDPQDLNQLRAAAFGPARPDPARRAGQGVAMKAVFSRMIGKRYLLDLRYRM